MKKALFLSILSLLIFSCSNQGKRLEPFRWPAIDERFDSLTLRLDYGFHNYLPVDSIARDVATLDSIVNGIDPHDIRAIRSCYWRGRLLLRKSRKDSAAHIVQGAIERTDSAKFPYEFFRLRALMRQLSETSGAQSFHELDEEAQFYGNLDDTPMLASTYISIGTTLYPIGELQKSLEYINKANELYSKLGFDKIVARNGINVANIHFRLGENEEATKLLTDLLDNPAVTDDSTVCNLVRRNLYVQTNDIHWLREAYKDVRNKVNQRNLQGLYEALLSNRYYSAGNIDSAKIYSRRAMGNLRYVTDYSHLGMITQAYASTMENEGKIDSALYYQKLYMQYSDSDITRSQQAEVLRMANMREVSLSMLRENERAQRMRLNFIGTLFVVLMGAGAIYFMLYRKQKRHQIASRNSRLEMEKNRRHLLAVMLAMEEKDNLFNSLKSEIEAMRKEGTIGTPEAARIENSIKLHLAGGEEWETFQQLFGQANPDFVSRLHNAYPMLSDTYVKLATYIYMGLDNNKIARMLVIRPESVKQARWRLRRMMGLDKDVSLDDAIRALGN